MNWFLAKIVYRIICGDGNHTPQFDEQLRLITAENEKDALNKAFNIGKQEEDCFLNNVEKLVQWKFINVAELYSITNLIDGAELYSKIEEKENGDLYTESVHKRAASLRRKNAQHILQPS